MRKWIVPFLIGWAVAFVIGPRDVVSMFSRKPA
jgi:hypothetical protein